MLSHRYACYNTYETADGRYMAVGALESRFWKDLCAALELEQYADKQYDEAERREIIDAFQAKFRQKSMAEWEKALGSSDLCVSGIRTMAEALDAPMFRHREMALAVSRPDGTSETALGVPVKLSRTPGAVRTPSVQFGENTAAILMALGYTEEEIEALQNQGVV